jgi:hypothetical protein
MDKENNSNSSNEMIPINRSERQDRQNHLSDSN